jgi:hypothetical protein
MTGARSHLRGHPIRFTGGEWVYEDTGTPTVGNPRDCGVCGKADTPEGHDPCLGTIPGVFAACCGHGNPAEAYVVLEGGERLAGQAAREYLAGREARP